MIGRLSCNINLGMTLDQIALLDGGNESDLHNKRGAADPHSNLHQICAEIEEANVKDLRLAEGFLSTFGDMEEQGTIPR